MHYMDTMVKAKKAKAEYMLGKPMTVIAQELGIDYVTLWRWLKIAGITKAEKKEHEIKRLEREVLEHDQWIDGHDCHKSKSGEDGCECDTVARRIMKLRRQLTILKGGE